MNLNTNALPALTIASISIRQDDGGRYCLNDLHKAAVLNGANERTKEPSKFLASPQTSELIKELTDTQNMGVAPVNAIKGGNRQGTYAVKELVYAYAMWISPVFHLHVIRAYDALVMATKQPAQADLFNSGDSIAISKDEYIDLLKIKTQKLQAELIDRNTEKPRQKGWSKEEIARLLELTKQGLTQEEIGEKLGRGRFSVGKKLLSLLKTGKVKFTMVGAA